ncbi:MAG: hypothetical protein ACPLKQ_08065 [Candidatus Bathyarchaeales archaeon]
MTALSLKKFNVALVSAVVLMLLLLQIPTAYLVESTTGNKVLAFLKDVVGLDITKYDAKQVTVPVQSDLSDLYETGWIKYTLTSPESKIDILCNFRNNLLVWCKLTVIAGSPLYIQSQPANVIEAAKGIIQRYQIYSGASYIKTMQNMLEQINELKPAAIKSDNVKLNISIEENYAYIKWMYTINNIDVPSKAVSLIFKNGDLYLFRDTWDLYKIGTTEVVISKEEAISIAKKHVQKYSYTVDGILISNFTILDEQVIATLSMQDRGNYTLYPHWEIRMGLDRVYPGGVTGFQVMLWADTGEVTHITPIGSLGGPELEGEDSSTPSPEPEPEPSPKPNFSSTSIPIGYIYAISAVAIVAATVACSYLYIKRKSVRKKAIS